MRISPYITFNGNCSEAISFYEKALKVQARVMFYKDAPQDGDYQIAEGTENQIMHAQFELGSEALMMCDTPPDYPITAGNNIAIMAEFDDVETVKAVFNGLKEGGTVVMELQETFWNKCFGSLIDKFGIYWHVSLP